MKNKPLNWYNQSSVIPYRIKNEKVQLLIITTRKKKRWIFPKGIIEENMSPEESAVKEAFEEAGVSGKLLNNQIGIYYYKKWGGKCKVKVYCLEVSEVLENWEENFRERQWINAEDIENYISKKKLIHLVKKCMKNI